MHTDISTASSYIELECAVLPGQAIPVPLQKGPYRFRVDRWILIHRPASAPSAVLRPYDHRQRGPGFLALEKRGQIAGIIQCGPGISQIGSSFRREMQQS